MRADSLRGRLRSLFICIAVCVITCAALGCGSEEKVKDPVVSVQTTAAHRTTISQVISADAVVFPLQQAIITPKITSTIKTFLVQRGSRVRKGQLLAILENADLSAAAEQSKGEFEQAEAGYATTTGASLPEQIRSGTTRRRRKAHWTHNSRSTTAAKNFSTKEEYRGETLILHRRP